MFRKPTGVLPNVTGLLSQVSDRRLGAVLRQCGNAWYMVRLGVVGQWTYLDDAKVRGNVWDRLKASCGCGAARGYGVID